MLRWLFLFLLLINVLLLFWFSSFKPVDETREETVEQRLHSIRLLSEIDHTQLQQKEQSSNSVPKPPQCWLLSEFRQLDQAELARTLIETFGLQAKLLSGQISESRYVVKVELDSSGRQHQQLAAYLRASRSLDIRPQDLGLDSRYIIGRYNRQADAEAELQQLVIAGLNAFLVYEEQTDNRYEVAVFDRSGQKLSKEIKEIVLRQHSDIKIEKKVCEGVARP